MDRKLRVATAVGIKFTDVASREALLQQDINIGWSEKTWRKEVRQICLKFEFELVSLAQDIADIIHPNRGQKFRQTKAKAIVSQYYSRSKKRQSPVDRYLKAAVMFLRNLYKPDGLVAAIA